MTLSLAVSQRAQYLDSNGDPLSGGQVTFYDVQTGFLKDVYLDPDGIIQAENPLKLDAGGFVPESGIFYGLGNYKIKVEKLTNPLSPIPVYSQEYIIPNVPGTLVGMSGSTSTMIVINAVEQLVNVTPNSVDYVLCGAYYINGTDSGGGLFRWSENSTAPTNLGTIFATSGSPVIGRFIRVQNGVNLTSEMFGVYPNKDSDMSQRIIQGAQQAGISGVEFVLCGGEIQFSSSFSLSCVKITISELFKSVILVPLTPRIVITINAEEININGFSDHGYMILNSARSMELYPEWFGAVGGGSVDDYTAFYYLSLSTGRKVFSQIYNILASGAPVPPEIIFDNCFFKKGSRILNKIGLITIKNMSVENGALWVLKGWGGNIEYDATNFIVECQAYAHWLFDLNPNAIQFASNCKMISIKKLIWNYVGTFNLVNQPNDPFQAEVIHEVEKGCLLAVSGSFQSSTPNWFCSWFADGIISSLQLSQRNSNSWTDGGGLVFNQVNAFILNANTKIKNITLISSGFNFHASNLVSVVLQDSTIVGNLFDINSATYSFYAQRCSFETSGTCGAYGLITSLNYCSFYTSNAGAASFTLGNSTYNDTYILCKNVDFGNLSVNCYFDVNSKQSIFNACNSLKAITFYSPKNVIFTSNECESLNLTSNSSGFAIKGLIAKENIFTAIALPQNKGVLTSANIATDGHKCSVYDNYCTNGNSSNSTRVKNTISITPSIPSNSVRLSSYTNTTNFPKFLPFNVGRPLSISCNFVKFNGGGAYTELYKLTSKEIYNELTSVYEIATYNRDSSATEGNFDYYAEWSNVNI